MGEADRSIFASSSLTRHLIRGAAGFGLFGLALALTSRLGATSLLLAVPAVLALRGCPTCWIVGLIETISAGRLSRTCEASGCSLSTRDRSASR